MPRRLNASGCFNGSSMPSRSRSRASSSPPMSSQPTVGASTITSRIADGWTRFKALSKSRSSTDKASSTSVGMISSARLIRGRSGGPPRAPLPGSGGEVGADEAVGAAREVIEIDVCESACRVWMPRISRRPPRRELRRRFHGRAGRGAKRLVERFGSVGRGDHDHILPRLEPASGSGAARPAAFPLAANLAALGAIESISSIR